MKNTLSESRKKDLTILLAALAAVAAVYMAVCDYAGVSGNIEFLQQEFLYIGQSLRFIKYPYWFIHGTLSGMLAVLLIYVIYRMKSSKKRYGTLILCLFLPYFLNAHFKPGSEKLRVITIFMTLIVGGLFAMANIPGMVSRAITRQLIFQDSELKYDAEELCKQKLRRMEWVCFFPLKKVLFSGLWIANFALGLLAIVAFCNDPQLDFLTTGLFLLAIAAFMAPKVWRYIITQYHCVPVLNKVFSKKQIQSLLEGEQFELFLFEQEGLQKYTPVLVSENWALIEGLLVSRKLALRGDIDNGGIAIKETRTISRVKMTYLNGERFQTRAVDVYLNPKCQDELRDALNHITGIRFPRCAPEKIMQKYDSILPEIQNPEEKLWYLLTHDVTEIKKEYEAIFQPENGPKKKGKRKKYAGRERLS